MHPTENPKGKPCLFPVPMCNISFISPYFLISISSFLPLNVFIRGQKNTILSATSNAFNKNLSTNSENDYDIDINNEIIDVLSIVSEAIISKMEFTNICKKDCKGLCSLCGKNQNKYVCSHDEKNIKESPFSSLSELDL